MSDSFATTPQNRLRQLREKGCYERAAVWQVIDTAPVASVGFVQDGRPVVVPMIHGRDGDVIYLHGARKARVVRLLAETRSVCINFTLVDGIVYARSAFNSSMNYRSATVFGTPRLVDDPAEKLHGMQVISEHIMPGRWAELRDPHEREVKMTGVIAVAVESGSAKISAGMPDDEDEDYAIPVWAGVLPLETRTGTPLDDERLVDGVQPSDAVTSRQKRRL